MHQPLIAGGGISGQATDLDIQAREILRLKVRLNRILSHHTGQTMEVIERDTDRDRYFTAQQAVEYGLVDGIMGLNDLSTPTIESALGKTPLLESGDADFVTPAIASLPQYRPSSSEVRSNSRLPPSDQPRGSERAHISRKDPSFEPDENSAAPTGNDHAGARASVM